jgi:hypothetical protein
MFDATGSYVTAFTIAAVLLTVSIPTILLVKRPGNTGTPYSNRSDNL